jgi:hypothetical protein
MFQTNTVEKIKRTFNVNRRFSENRAVYEIINALLHFHNSDDYANASQCYLLRALSTLLKYGDVFKQNNEL